jgi:hypothetical protein
MTITQEILNQVLTDLPDVYTSRLEGIQTHHNHASAAETITYLVDYYSCETPDTIKQLQTNLSKRISTGINRDFLYRLRLIHTLLHHILTITKYI